MILRFFFFSLAAISSPLYGVIPISRKAISYVSALSCSCALSDMRSNRASIFFSAMVVRTTDSIFFT